MIRGTRTVYPGERNKGLSSTFQPPEEGQSIQQPKRCDKHGNKDEDNSPKNVHNTSSQKYRRMKYFCFICFIVISFFSYLFNIDLLFLLNHYLVIYYISSISRHF